MDGGLPQLAQRGFAWIRDDLADSSQAFEAARVLIEARTVMDGLPALSLLGTFVLPPEDGQESRNFQTLHFDFGVPLDPKVEQDVARYTALHVPKDFAAVSAVTRLVPLAALLRQRAWPSHTELIARLVTYGKTHGAWNDDRGYVEGSLARIVEAAAGLPALPSVKVERDFLCGLEFDSLASELHFFEHLSLSIDQVVIEVPLAPGELLVFDNLALAHGRRGTRQPGELRQWIFGESKLGTAQQHAVRDLLLAAFHAPSPGYATRVKASATSRRSPSNRGSAASTLSASVTSATP